MTHFILTITHLILTFTLCGMRTAQALVSGFKPRTRRRYIERARELSRRKPGRPVGTQKQLK